GVARTSGTLWSSRLGVVLCFLLLVALGARPCVGGGALVGLRLALRRGFGRLALRATTGVAVEQWCGRAPCHHGIRYLVGLFLQRVASRREPLGHRDPAALLHDVGGLVRRRVQCGALAERHTVARGIGFGAQLRRCL